MTRTWRALFGRVGEFNARIEENVGGMRVVQAFANEDYERHLFAGDNARYRATKLEAYRIMAASMSLSYLSMRFTQLVVMIAGTYFVLHGRAERGRVRQLPPAGRRLLPAGGEDQRRPGDLPQGDRRVQALHRAAGHRAGHRRRARRDRGLGSARRHPLRERDLRLRPGADGAARHQPRHPRRGDGRLRRSLRRRQDDDLPRCCRASTRSTPAGSPSTASISGR